MAVFKKIGKFLLGGVLGAVLGGGKKQLPAPQPLPQATRDDAAAAASREDELRRRKGAAADIITGSTGAEAALSSGRFNPMGN